MILAVALACVAAALAVPVKVFLDQRSAVAALQQQIGLQEQRIATLRAQEAAWSSPAYVQAQARSRLHYVLPGETDYIVIGGPPAAPVPAPPGVVNSAGSSGPEPAWYTQLWDSVRATAQSPAG